MKCYVLLLAVAVAVCVADTDGDSGVPVLKFPPEAADCGSNEVWKQCVSSTCAETTCRSASSVHHALPARGTKSRLKPTVRHQRGMEGVREQLVCRDHLREEDHRPRLHGRLPARLLLLRRVPPQQGRSVRHRRPVPDGVTNGLRYAHRISIHGHAFASTT
ncbi:hypothetical protein MRX96_005931 [Rhipicephalus microplus]